MNSSAAGTSRLSICVVEQNPLAGDHLRQILQHDPAWAVSLFDPQLEPRRLPRQRADAFVLDQGTLPVPLSKLLRFLRLRHPKARILLLDHPSPDDELCRLLFLGVHGFLSYEEVETSLIPALHALLEGHYWMPPRALELYVNATARLYTRKSGRPDTLTTHERRIVELVKRRLSNREIASILSISESTVSTYLVRIFAKLGVRDRQAMVEVAAARSQPEPLPQKPK